ncbi:hypothetical protein JAAARDRAFT_681065 [Jaapia argillacea MUCL 33604]|uniref:Protein kinase domain-containing protein n=1 Tax=Jaapia argillacea MUCL 33604 TaxID=933084 RepID=A0A067P5P2_9AGAM|nr:hypothetical protein JAAARDRAFT_681065 [Jaapia argillacea MUCL 33604]
MSPWRAKAKMWMKAMMISSLKLRGLLVGMVTQPAAIVLARSSGLHQVLLEIVQKRKPLDDLTLHGLLSERDGDIARLVQAILDSDEQMGHALKLEGEEANSLMVVLQRVLDRVDDFQSYCPEGFRFAAHGLLIRLSRHYDSLPSSLFVSGLELPSLDPVAGGGFADILRGQLGQVVVAVKRLRRVFSSPEDQIYIRKLLYREALIWKGLDHPYVLQFLGVASDVTSGSICLVSPWMVHGDMMTYLASRGSLGVSVNELLFQVASGLLFLHSKDIIHGDLRGRNILIGSDHSSRIADFGLAIVADRKAAWSTKGSGSTRWMAPELLFPNMLGIPFQRTFPTDVYAYACVCLEVYTEAPPFSSVPTDAELILQILKGLELEKPPASQCRGRVMPHFLWMLMKLCWNRSPDQRPTIRRVVASISKHPQRGFGNILRHRHVIFISSIVALI